MAEGNALESRVAILSPSAVNDYSQIHSHTTWTWGQSQADRYSDLLDAEILQVAQDPEVGKPVEGLPTVRGRLIRWPKARHGHRIIYLETDYGIYVLRILHSAMNVSRHLEEE
ncbi:type II toxin-antitoxin system RelE/ParE family toxin [bacterium]|nr:MAG: type II toxin-antitoxin system RelE/ParE family toxin [bacterium]